MLFNSVEYFIFLPIVLGLYYALGLRWQNWMLLLASYIFYGWWDVRFLFLIVVSTAIDYCGGLLMGTGRVPRRELGIAVVVVVASAVLFLGVPWSDLPGPIEGRTTFEGSGDLVYPWWDQIATGTASLGRALSERQALEVFALSLVGAFAFAGFVGVLERMEESRRRKLALFASMCSNLGIFGFFKYFNFFVESAEVALGSLGMAAPGLSLEIILPVGISFYTFQTMSYGLDVYRRRMEPVRSLRDFALFVAYFPQLVAGPIERAEQLLPRLQSPRHPTLEGFRRGSFLILFGLFKKIAIADGIAGPVNAVYGSSGSATWLDVVGATILFTIQIYCDFSGYSDVARGTSKLMGIELMVNFDLPYFAKGPSEFWRRWHISLSTWLRDYLYISIGGNRGVRAMVVRNLMITMLLGGLWHGAAWNFVLWGLYHGVILSLYRFVPRPRLVFFEASRLRPLIGGIQILLFLPLTLFGWLLFRAESLGQIAMFSGELFGGFDGLSTSINRPSLSAIAGVLVLIGWELYQYASGTPHFYQEWPRPIRGVFYALLLVLILMGLSNEPTQFIYFQF